MNILPPAVLKDPANKAESAFDWNGAPHAKKPVDVKPLGAGFPISSSRPSLEQTGISPDAKVILPLITKSQFVTGLTMTD